MWLLLAATGFVTPVDPCPANVVFVGTVISAEASWSAAPGVEPRHPAGKIVTRSVYDVERLLVDTIGEADDDRVVVVAQGGRLGALAQDLAEEPYAEVGERLMFALRFVAGEADPFVLEWRRIPPGTEVPAEDVLRREWTRRCPNPG